MKWAEGQSNLKIVPILQTKVVHLCSETEDNGERAGFSNSPLAYWGWTVLQRRPEAKVTTAMATNRLRGSDLGDALRGDESPKGAAAMSSGERRIKALGRSP